MRRLLLKAAQAGRTVTYGELMELTHMPRGRMLSRAIGMVDADEARRGSPGFAAIVVRKDTGFPGGGFFCDASLPPGVARPHGQGSRPTLSAREREYAEEQRALIWLHYARRRAPRGRPTT